MKGNMMKSFTLCFILLFPIAVCLAETEPPAPQLREPQLYDHIVAMQQTQEQLSRLPLEEKERLQPQIRRAELRAFERHRRGGEGGGGGGGILLPGGEIFFALMC